MSISSRHHSRSERDEARRRHHHSHSERDEARRRHLPEETEIGSEAQRETPRSATYYDYQVSSAFEPRSIPDITPSYYSQPHSYASDPDFQEHDAQYTFQPSVEGNTQYEHTTASPLHYGSSNEWSGWSWTTEHKSYVRHQILSNGEHEWDYSTPWETPKQVRALSKVLPIALNGHPHNACADTGCAENLISKDFAIRIGAAITEETCVFDLPLAGVELEAYGWTKVMCDFPTSQLPSIHRDDRLQLFWVCKSLSRNVILGREFLDSTKTLTEYSGRLISISKAPKYVNSLQPNNSIQPNPCSVPMSTRTSLRMQCWADGVQEDKALPDTGSDFNLISTEFAARLGHKHYNKDDSDEIVFADLKVADVWSLGTIDLVISFAEPQSGHNGGIYRFLESSSTTRQRPVLNQNDSFRETFHVVDGLALNLILGQTFLYSIDAFRNKNFEDNLIRGPEDRLVAESGPSSGRKSLFTRHRAPVAPAQISVYRKFKDICQHQDVDGNDRRWRKARSDHRMFRDCHDFNDIWPYAESVVTNGELYDICFPPRHRRR